MGPPALSPLSVAVYSAGVSFDERGVPSEEPLNMLTLTPQEVICTHTLVTRRLAPSEPSEPAQEEQVSVEGRCGEITLPNELFAPVTAGEGWKVTLTDLAGSWVLITP
jgi:hypothetical protein